MPNYTFTYYADTNANGFSPTTIANGLNNNGEVVGFYYDSMGQTHGFLDDNGTYTTLDDPNAVNGTYAYGINDSGEIIGQYVDGGNIVHYFLDNNGTYTTLQDPSAVGSTFVSVDGGINDSGEAVGTYSDGFMSHGFLYDNGTHTTIDDPLAVGNGTFAYGINNAGDIVGGYTDTTGEEHGFLDVNGTFTTIDDPLASSRYGTQLESISNNGQIVGYYYDNNGNPQSFIYNNGTFTPLVNPQALIGAPLTAINDAADVVGQYFPPQSLGFEDVNGTYTALGPPGAQGGGAVGINNSGEIVGNFYNRASPEQMGYLDNNGTYTTLTGPVDATTVSVSGINAGGEIVGGDFANFDTISDGFLYENGTYFTIDDPNGYYGTSPTAINNFGEIVGYYYDSSDFTHGFTKIGGTYTTINDPLGANGTTVSGVNNSGELVGYYSDSNGSSHGFTDVNGTFTTLDDPLGVQGTFLNSINNNGEIVGDYFDGSGNRHAFSYSNGTFTTIDDALGSASDATGVNDSGVVVGNYIPTINTEQSFLGALPVPTTLIAAAANLATGDFNVGRAIAITLATSASVTVTGTPTLTLNDNGVATYDAAKSTGTSLVFDYTVGSGQNTTALAATAVNLPNGAAITDGNNNAAVLSLPASATFTGLQIDTTAPASVHDNVLSVGAGLTVAVPASVLQFTDNFSTDAQETYTITGAPGDGALLKSGTPTSSFTQADIDNGLISYHETNSNASSDSIGFTVTDGAGNTTTAQQLQIQISSAASIASAAIQPSSGAFDAGGSLAVTLTMSGAVTVTGTPTLSLNDGGTATYDAAHSTSTALVFDYTVGSGQNTAALAAATVNLPNGAMITDSNNNNANLTLPASAIFTGLEIDTTTPTAVHNSGLALGIGQTAAIPASALQFTDNLSSDAQETYTITSAPADGTLLKNGSPTSSFTQADIDNGLISYQETNLNASSDSFAFTVSDAAGNTTAVQQFSVQISPTLLGTGLRFVGAGRSGAASGNLVWQNNDGTPTLWTIGSGGTTQVTLEPNPGAAWQIVALGDLDSDGSADLLFQYSDGTPAVWFMNGTNLASSAFLPNPGSGWSIEATGDFYDTGHDNSILWQSTGRIPAIWEMNGTAIANSAALPDPTPGWSILGTGDFFDTGFDNTILWQSTGGVPALWEMNGGTLVNDVALPNPGPGWSIRAEGNLSGDGHNDSILLQYTNGLPVLWQVNGPTVVNSLVLPNPGASWTILGTGAVAGNGLYDIFLQNTSGQIAEWSMNGSTLLSNNNLTSNALTLNGPGSAATGSGSETITFNAANQTFIDGSAVYNDTVIGFSQGNGDRIHLTTDTVTDVLAHTTQVNSGQDTQISLTDGSMILLKGVTSINSSFFS